MGNVPNKLAAEWQGGMTAHGKIGRWASELLRSDPESQLRLGLEQIDAASEVVREYAVSKARKGGSATVIRVAARDAIGSFLDCIKEHGDDRGDLETALYDSLISDIEDSAIEEAEEWGQDAPEGFVLRGPAASSCSVAPLMEDEGDLLKDLIEGNCPGGNLP